MEERSTKQDLGLLAGSMANGARCILPYRRACVRVYPGRSLKATYCDCVRCCWMLDTTYLSYVVRLMLPSRGAIQFQLGVGADANCGGPAHMCTCVRRGPTTFDALVTTHGAG